MNRESGSWRTNCVSGIRGNPSRKKRVILMSTDSLTGRDKGVSVRPPFLWQPFSTGLCLRRFLWRSLFLAVFTVDLAITSRISSFPQILGLSESRRQSPGWHILDGVLPILFLALPLRVTARQEQVGSAALSGHPFSLKYLVYASCFSTSAGALGRMHWSIQGLFQDSPSKVFSLQTEARSWSRWS